MKKQTPAIKRFLYPAFAALALTGCASRTISPLSEFHPANPHAPEAPRAAAASTLVEGAEVLVLPISTNQVETHHHAPAAKGAPSPAEHKHHEHKQEEKK